MEITNPYALLQSGVEEAYANGLESQTFPAWAAAGAWNLHRAQLGQRQLTLAVLMTACLGYPDHDELTDQLLPEERAVLDACDPATADWPDPVGATNSEGDLAKAKTRALAAAERTAGVTRSEIVTSCPGKVGTYMLKAELAERAIAGDAEAEACFTGEAAVRGMTAAELAALVVTKAADWAAAAFAIDTAVVVAKAAIEAAEDEATVFDAINQLGEVLSDARQQAMS